MTECERLIANGTFTRDFFKPEVRCDFLVDENRKKIWAILLDLMLVFDRFCKDHGLKYFLDGGTLLGAVRHKGIIPWDDDVDVDMKRDDYEKLIALADEFPEPYFLQFPGREKGYGYSYIKLRNSNTSGVCKLFAYEEFNQGLFLDIFPLDGVVYSEGERVFNEIKALNMDNSTCMRMHNPNLDADNLARVASCSNRDIQSNLTRIDELAKSFGSRNFDRLSPLVFTGYPYVKNCFKREDFDSSVQLPIEGFHFSAPVGYEDILTTTFGDYMKFPPVESRGCRHDGLIFDADIPYLTHTNI